MNPLHISEHRDRRFALPYDEAHVVRAEHIVFRLIREAAEASPELRLCEAVDKYILGTLLQVAGNRSVVAGWWGVSNKTLYNKWIKYWPGIFGNGTVGRR